MMDALKDVLMGGVIGDSVHRVAYARHVNAFLCGNRCERNRQWWWSGCVWW